MIAKHESKIDPPVLGPLEPVLVLELPVAAEFEGVEARSSPASNA